MKQKMLMHGGPQEGFVFVGPFECEEDAMAYAEDNRLDASWWIIDLENPGMYS